MVLENLKLRVMTHWYGYETELDSNLHTIQWICIAFLTAALLGSMVKKAHINEKYAIALADGELYGNQMKSLEELSNHLERLLDPETSCFSDVTIKSGNAFFPAHKNILSARSPVFAALFSSLVKESNDNEVDASDIYAPILQALLTYIYTGKTNDLSASSAADLLFAADKYQLQDLKGVCSNVLKKAISIQNALTLLVLGDSYAEDLKSFVVDYICNNRVEFSVIEKSQEWRTLQKEKPDLAMYVLTSLVNSQKN